MLHLADYKILSIQDTVPNDALSKGMLNLRNVPETTEETVIAIIDSGIDREHPDLSTKIIHGHNFVGDPKDFSDKIGHGTHVAGIISGAKTGITPGCKILVLKVFDSDGSTSYETVIEALEFSIRWRGLNGEKVSVVNLSLGAPEDNTELSKTIDEVVKNNILICCAAGNEGDGDVASVEMHYPACYKNVLSVGAISLDGSICKFSNSNNEVDVCAPGYNITSTYLGDKYATMSGTSQACPHASALAALYISKYKKRFGSTPTVSDLLFMFKLLSTDVDRIGLDANSGAGLIQAWV